MDEVNGIDMHFIYRKRGHSLDSYRLWTERKRILKPEKARIVGKGSHNERLQEYRPSQQARKRKVELNIQMYNRFFHYCETLGTTTLKEYQQNSHESWLGQNLSDNKSQVSTVKQEKSPTNALRKFRKHDTVNLIRLKETVKTNTIDDEHKSENIERKQIKKRRRVLLLICRC